jgi:predicted acylesterase/phospholipase RssA
MSAHLSEHRQRAENIIQGQAESPGEILRLVKALKNEQAFGLARRVLSRARRDWQVHDGDRALLLDLIQQHALCTYQDPDLPAHQRLDCALQILQAGEDLAKTRHQETLGLAGAIYKRLWELDGQRRHLERSLAYYLRGYEQGVASDYGYTAINAAYVLDLLASEEVAEANGPVSAGVRLRREQATRTRNDIVATLPELPKQPGEEWLEQEWWFLATLGEAYFGLGRYDEALAWLHKGRGLPGRAAWEYESTARQLANLARLQHKSLGTLAAVDGSPAWKALREFLGNDVNALHSAFVGKVGLALSGGGFRASLFHIGVLARLAELDVLRSIEVLSCVSGGSIIGAHYYLEVRKLLQTKPDTEITRQDYIDIVQRIERDFLAGVQRNVRTRMLADWAANVKMMLWPNYSRTLRLGELYEEEIYSRVEDGGQHGPRWLSDLFVRPVAEPAEFLPRRDNWRRRAKVPILILNATPLNTGHNWQFTASWMGEPPTYIDTEVDSNDRLRRMYYEQAPAPHKRVRLGHAVAASSCVPGLFQPIALDRLYPDRTVRLVDGGVHDNQGIAGLLGEECTVMLVSDASGQIESLKQPNAGLLAVPLRSNSILMARVREAEYRELDARHRAGLLRGLMFVHLKKDLDVHPIDWLGCNDPYKPEDHCRGDTGHPALTRYGMRKYVQHKLADIRTDLDSFSDMEAFALMTSGYRMTEHEFARTIQDLPAATGEPSDWRFLSIERALRPDTDPEEHERLMRVLDVACNQGFKVWRLSPGLTVVGLAIAALGLAQWVWAVWTWRSAPLVTVGQLASALLVAGAVFLGANALMRLIRYRKTLGEMGIGFGMATIGFLAALAHLHVFDKLYLRRGRVRAAGG